MKSDHACSLTEDKPLVRLEASLYDAELRRLLKAAAPLDPIKTPPCSALFMASASPHRTHALFITMANATDYAAWLSLASVSQGEMGESILFA